MTGLELLSEGAVDLAFAGDDILDELELSGRLANLQIADSSELSFRFALEAPEAGMNNIAARLEQGDPLSVATSYPATLAAFAAREGLNLRVAYEPLGGCEMFPKAGLTDLAYDLVNKGDTLADNGLAIYCQEEPLCLRAISAIKLRAKQPADPLRRALGAVADTYAQQLKQASEPEQSTDSYTVQLLRDQNRLVKKFGEEGAEFLQAALRARPSRSELRAEGSDLVYIIGLWLARNGVTLTEVLDEDIRRNNLDEEENGNG